MNTAIEYKEKPAVLNPDFGYIRTEDWQPVPAGSTVTICAWHHNGPELSSKAEKMGYQISHGICSGCKQKQLEQIKKGIK